MQKTLENLAKAFIGESQARNRYTMYAEIAHAEGFEEVAANFELTAAQEAQHAKLLMKTMIELKGGEVADAVPVGAVESPIAVGDTAANLAAAAAGEKFEYSEMYMNFAKDAEEEGLGGVAARLKTIAKAEENHEANYLAFLERVTAGEVFKGTTEAIWVCRHCGFIHQGLQAPGVCPLCGKPQAFFERKK